MKKTGILLLLVCMMFGSIGFADDGGPLEEELTLSSNQRNLFTLPMNGFCYGEILDLDYSPDEGLFYLITKYQEVWDGEVFYSGRQFPFDLDGNFGSDPFYPELDGSDRKGIEFTRSGVYTIECDQGGDFLVDSDESTFIYDAKKEMVLSEYDLSAKYGFAANDPYMAFLYDREASSDEEDPNFLIDEIALLGNPDDEKVVLSPDAGRISAYDFTPSGSEFIFGAFSCDEGSDLGIGFRVISVDSSTGKNTGNDFLLTLPDEVDVNQIDTNWKYNGFRGLIAAKDYIVVLFRIGHENCGYIQRYSYSGELLESYKTEYCVGELAEGPNNSVLYLQKNHDDDSYYDVIKVTWNLEKSVGRPKPMISERTVGGQTTAEFRDDGFGLLKVTDSESGAMNYLAPLKSDEDKVRLRIPFADILTKVNAGADNLLITYRGNEITIPMSRFDCTELLDGMPCQDDATIEIQLSVGEDGSIKIVIQVFVVEQVDDITKVVHRETIQ